MKKSQNTESLLSPRTAQGKVTQSPSIVPMKSNSNKNFEDPEGISQRSIISSSMSQPGFPHRKTENSGEINGVYEFRKTCYDKIKTLESIIDCNKSAYENEINHMQEYIRLLKIQLGEYKETNQEPQIIDRECFKCIEKSRDNSRLCVEIEQMKNLAKEFEEENYLLKNDNLSKKQEIVLLSKKMNEKEEFHQLFEVIAEMEENKQEQDEFIGELQREMKKMEVSIKEKENLVESLMEKVEENRVNQEKQTDLKKKLEETVETNLKKWENKLLHMATRTNGIDQETQRLQRILIKLNESLKEKKDGLNFGKDIQSLASEKFKQLMASNSKLTENIEKTEKESKELVLKIKETAEENIKLKAEILSIIKDHEKSKEAIKFAQSEIKLYQENAANLAKHFKKIVEPALKSTIPKLTSKNQENSIKCSKTPEDAWDICSSSSENEENHKVPTSILSETFLKLTKNCCKIKEKMDNLNGELKQVTEESAILREENQVLHETIVDLKTENKSLMSSLSQLNHSLYMASAELQSLEAKSKDLEESKNNLELELESQRLAHAENFDSSTKVAGLTEILLANNMKLQQDAYEIRDLNKKIERLEQGVKEIDEEKEDLVLKVNELARVNSETMEQLDEKVKESFKFQEILEKTLGIIKSGLHLPDENDPAESHCATVPKSQANHLKIESFSVFHEKSVLNYLDIIKGFAEKIKSLQSSNENFELSIVALQEKLEIQNSEIFELNSKKNAFFQENAQLSNALENLKEETQKVIENLKKQLSARNKELVTLQKILSDSLTNVENRSKTFEKKQELGQEFEELEDQNLPSEFTDVINDLTGKVGHLLESNHLLERSNFELQGQITHLLAELSKAKPDLPTVSNLSSISEVCLQPHMEELLKEKQQIAVELAQATEKIRQQHSEISDLHIRLKDLSNTSKEPFENSKSQSSDKESTLLSKLKYQADQISELENKNIELETRFNRIRNKNNLLESNTKKYSENVEKLFKDVNRKLGIIDKHLSIKEEKLKNLSNDYMNFKSKYIDGFQEKSRVFIQNWFDGKYEKDRAEEQKMDKDDLIKVLKDRVEFLQDKINALVKSNYVTREIIENISDKAHDAIERIKVE